jgi:hypothetical protein
MKIAIQIILILVAILACTEKSTLPVEIDDRDILEKLNSISEISAREITPQNGFKRQFEVYITQPLNHQNPSGSKFQQRIFISHIDESAPVVFMPSGYSSSPVKVAEISNPLHANQVYVAHRFMIGARPSGLDWQYLTIEQASNDFHRVVEVLKRIFTGAWISYGVSKNGQAALYHRRYFPDDVVGTIALSASLSLGIEDYRYENFLNNIGTVSEREKIKLFQRKALTERDQIIPMITNYINSSEFHFTRMNASEILEFEVLEFPFSFWQSTSGDCSTIPDTSSTSTELYNYLKNFGYFDFYSDELLDYYESVYYQAYTELGWYRLIDDDVKDLLIAIPNPSYRLMTPQNAALNFNPQIIPDAINWLQTEGNNIIYIYGNNDPWSAGSIESVGSTNAIKIVKAGANHSVSISDLEEKELIYSIMNQWINQKK